MDALPDLTRALAGRYAPIREIGRGGMAVVYLADDVRHHRRVAIKVLRPEISAAVGHDRFVQEINLAASLQHPHILPLHDSGSFESDAGTRLYYVMPYVEGETLRQRLERDGQLPLEEALELACQVLSALAHAHARGVVHRDIKPENILLADGNALVVDFGIARALDDGGTTRLTERGTIVGTPAYMSPEQAAGERAVDGRSDLYSLASVLFEMLCGEPPFTGHSAQAVMVKRLTDSAPSVRTLRETASEALDQALQKGLARHPADRFASADEFRTALRRCGPGFETPTATAAPQPIRWRRWGLAAVALAVIAAGLAWVLYRPPLPSGRRLAVAETQVIGGDSLTDYLQVGIPEYLVSELIRVPGLEVVPMSIVRLDSSRNSPVDLGRHLGATHVLATSLRPVGARKSISMELVEVETGRLLWTGRYALGDSGAGGFAPAVVSVIVDSLHLRSGNAAGSTLDPVTLDKLIRGFYLFGRAGSDFSGDSATIDSARVLFEQVLERAPGTPRAIAGLGSFYVLSYTRGWDVPGMNERQVYARGYALLDQALALDSAVSWAWYFRGVRQLYVEDRYDDAAESLRRALAADSGMPDAYRMRGVYRQEIMGDLPGALADYRQAVTLSPVPIRLNSLAAGLMAARRYEEAVPVLERSLDLTPSKHSWTRLVTTYEKLGRHADATRIRRQVDSTGSWAAPFERALAAGDTAAYARARHDELVTMVDSLIHRMENPPPEAPPSERMTVAELPIAALLCELQEPTRAMDYIERLYEARPPRLRWIVTNVDLGCLRDDPRYLPMVKAAGLEPYLRN